MGFAPFRFRMEPGRSHPGIHSIHQTGVRAPRLQEGRPVTGRHVLPLIYN